MHYRKLLYLCLFFANQIFAQNVHFHKIEIENKTPKSIFRDFLIDSKGYLWFGGFNTGLYRYDGYFFTRYVSNPNDSGSISSNSIDGLAEDEEGNIIVGTSNGLNIYHYSDNRFEKYFSNPDDNKSLSDNSITTVFIDSRKRIWIGTYLGGLNRYLPENHTFIQYRHEPGNPSSLSSNQVGAIAEAGRDTLWIGVHEGGIIKFYVRENRFKKYFSSEWGQENLLNLDVNQITKGENGELWVGTKSNGLFYVDPRSYHLIDMFAGTPLKDDSKFANVTTAAVDRQKKIWAGTFRNGLFSIDKNKNITHFEPSSGEQSISDWLVGGLFMDHSGNMFIGQWGPYIDVMYYTYPDFRYIVPVPENETDRNDYGNIVTAICPDPEQNLWISTQKEGVFMYQAGSNKWSRQLIYGWKGNMIRGDYATCMACLPEGRISIGTLGGGINILNNKTGKISHLLFDSRNENSVSDNNITAFAVSGDSILWIGTANGLNRYSISGGNFTRYFFNKDNANSISDNFITALHFIPLKNELWIGTKGGLNCFSSATKKFRRYYYEPRDTTVPADNYITALASDASGGVWAGTPVGLSYYIRSADNFTSYKKEDGMPVSEVASIQVDANGNIWAGLSHGHGLVKIDPLTRRVRSYNDDDNFTHPNVQRCSAQDSSGLMYFGTNSGFCVFNPAIIHEDTAAPLTRITAFQYFSKDKSGREMERIVNIFGRERVTLRPEENSFRIKYSTFCYKQTDKCTYRYRLLGKSDKWQHAGTSSTIRLNNLPSGRYVFEVLGTNNDQFPGREPARLVIRISQVFYKSVWFYLLLIIPLMGLVLFLNRRRIRRLMFEKTLIPGEITDTITDTEVAERIAQLNALMEKEKLYLNSELTIKDVAKRLIITDKELSNLLNRHLSKNFADYINEFRVEEAKKKLLDPANKDKIIFVAYESGFNSKAAFYSVFKKFTGMTPTDYRKKE